MRKSNAVTYFLLILRSAIYGSSVFFTGNLLQTTDTFDVLAIRFLISAVVFIILALTGVIHIDYRGKPLKLLLATAIFEPVLYFIFETYGIGGTTTTTAGIMNTLVTVFVVILEAVILKEKTTLSQKGFLLLSITGLIIITVFSSGDNSGKNTLTGMLFLLLAYLSGAFFIVCSRKSSQSFKPIEITFFTTMIGAISFNSINIVRHISSGTVSQYFKPLLSWENIVGFLFLSILSSIVATLMNNIGLSKLQASSACALGGLSTIISILLGVFINHEKISWYHIVGTVFIIVGAVSVNILQMHKKERELVKQALEIEH